ncbi:MAG: cytochrome c peroxidase [Planctomycetota bacterium]
MHDVRGERGSLSRRGAWAIALALAASASPAAETGPAPEAKFRSPEAVRFSPDGKRLAIADRTYGELAFADLSREDLASSRISVRVSLAAEPSALVWSRDGSRVWVSERGAGSVAEVDAAGGRVLRRFAVGSSAVGLAVSEAANRLVAADPEGDSVAVYDLPPGTLRGRVAVPRRPSYLALSEGGDLALVAHALPAKPATDPTTSALVTAVDVEKAARAGDVALPPGSVNLREIRFAPGGARAYVLHTVGRFHVPTTQLERGWVNTNAVSLIDVPARTCAATLLLDHPMEGAADPWGLALSPDGQALFATAAGVHQLCRIDLAGLQRFLEGKIPEGHRLARAGDYGPGAESIWHRVQRDPSQVAELVNDLSALYAADLILRVALPGKGPRSADLSPDGKLVAVAHYYSGSISVLDAATLKPRLNLSLGPEPSAPGPALEARLGEQIFHDATYCFQHWMSCATCHEEARADGLNWDLLNDGIGNPKNTRSLVWSHLTPPMMAAGVRADLRAAVHAGFVHIQFHEPEQRTVELVEAYLRSLAPKSSPRLSGGELNERARRGREIFSSEETRCATCHPAPLYTDLKSYDVGTKGPFDRAASFDTPTLVELWRTPPYLHDGSANGLRELFVERNRGDVHGKTSHLSPEDIDALVEFLLSL